MNEKKIEDYSDIIGLERPVSKKHLPMTRLNRAAQFAPFAALTGYGEAINETGRLVDKKIELSASEIDSINEKLRYIEDNKDKRIEISVLYFLPDEKKKGGKYVSAKGIVRRILPHDDAIEFEDWSTVKISDIKSITANEFENVDEYLF